MKYVPPAGATDPDAHYITGVPGKTRGSAVTAEAIEHPMREVVNAIIEAGLTPSADDLDQLTTAIKIIAAGLIPACVDTFVGDIRPMPYRVSNMRPGWHFTNGALYALTSPQGAALNAFDAQFKADWGIAVTGDNICLPRILSPDGKGLYIRGADGTTRQVGTYEADVVGPHKQFVGQCTSNLSVWNRWFGQNNAGNGAAEGSLNRAVTPYSGATSPKYKDNAGSLFVAGPQYDANMDIADPSETTVKSVAMTMAIYLGV